MIMNNYGEVVMSTRNVFETRVRANRKAIEEFVIVVIVHGTHGKHGKETKTKGIGGPVYPAV